MDGMQASALQTLDALEQRLRRIDFLLHGSSQDSIANDTAVTPSESSQSIASRLQSLEKSLQAVISQSDSATELLQLRKSARSMYQAQVS